MRIWALPLLTGLMTAVSGTPLEAAAGAESLMALGAAQIQNEVASPPYRPMALQKLVKTLLWLNSQSKAELEELYSEAPFGSEPSPLPSNTLSAAGVPSWPSALPLVADLDVPEVLPPQEQDKSHKFTHSIRFGYGRAPA